MATFNAGSIEATLDLDTDPFQRGLAEARGLGQAFGREKFTAKLDLDTAGAMRKAGTVERRLESAARRYTATFETRGLAEAAAEAAGLKQTLDTFDGRRTLDIDSTAAVAGIGQTRRGLRALIPLLAITATALTPLSAAALPALGLLNNLTLSAAAAGSLIIAFQGMGGALEAVNKAKLDPTVENLAAAEAALDQLVPSAAAFVVQLQEMGDEASALQEAAAGGFFPGAVTALERAETLLPRFNPLVAELASSLGIVADNTLRGLGSDQWMDFYDFAQREARPAVDGLAQSLGNLSGGLAGMWEGFDPLNDDFTEWLINITQRFEDWGQTLDENQGMTDLIGYVREVGPEAAETLQALGAGISSLVQASAPLGAVVLDVLEGIGNAVEFIAETPFGDELLLGAAAIYTVNKALGITQGLLTRMGVTAAGAGVGAGIAAGFGTATDKARGFGTAIRALPRDLTTLATTSRIAGARTERELSRVADASNRARVAMRGLAGAGAGIAALGVLGTEAGQGIGVTNTAMLGLAGYMIGGPWGAAAGAGAGYIMDIKGATDDATESVESWTQALSDNVATFSAHQGILESARADVDALRKDIDNPSFFASLFGAFDPDEWGNAIAGLSGETNTSKMEREYAELEAQMRRNEGAALSLASAFDFDIRNGMGEIADEKVIQLLERSGAAMQHFGVSYEELAAMPPIQRNAYVGLFAAYAAELDSVGARTDAFAETVADLGDTTLGTAEASDALGAALSALLSPALNAEAATDQWRASLKELREELKAGAGFEGFTEAAMENRQLTRDYTQDSMERLTALAGVGTTTQKDMAEAVRATRREFIESGIAAGFDRKQIAARADAMGLTPELVKTVFEAAGIERADLRARRLREVYQGMPKNVQTAIKAEGIPQTSADIDRLVEKYELTEKQRKALVTLKDLATKDINNVLERLGIVDTTNARPSVDVDGAGNALGQLQSLHASLNGLDGKDVTSTVTTVFKKVGKAVGGFNFATGGAVAGPGTGTSDSIPAMLSNGEHVWTAREVAAAGGHGAVEAMRAQFQGYAGGGPVVAPPRITAPRPATSRPATTVLSSADIDRLVAAIEANRGVYAHVTSREDMADAMRALEAELRRG